MSTAMILFAIVLVVLSVALTVVIVLQSNRGSEMSALTGRNNNAAGRGQSAKKEMFLKRMTVVLGLLFVVAVFVMDIVVAYK